MIRPRKTSPNSSLWIFTILIIAIALFSARNYLPINLSAIASTPTSNKEEIENTIKEYLIEHPEVIVDALKSMQERNMKEVQAKANAVLSTKKNELEANSPTSGNPKGDITIVEFFDYRCGYCKSANKTVQEILAKDKNVKVIYKEFPILGEESAKIAKMALAVYHIDASKYTAFHNSLMAAAKLDEEEIEKIAKELGLDFAKIKAGMDKAEVQTELNKIRELTTEINISGTPAFILQGELFPGAMDYDKFKTKIEEHRKNKKK